MGSGQVHIVVSLFGHEQESTFESRAKRSPLARKTSTAALRIFGKLYYIMHQKGWCILCRRSAFLLIGLKNKWVRTKEGENVPAGDRPFRMGS